jgi:hypothetical protein
MPQHHPHWSIAIFAARESIATLAACIRSVLAACKDEGATIDVLVNGNPELADEAVKFINSLNRFDSKTTVRVWFIALGDKAHAWNEYVHRIWQVSAVTYFVDGYIMVEQNALSLLHTGLEDSTDALAAAATPTSGRTATALKDRMLKEGGIHGNLYAIRGSVIKTLKQKAFCLPRGIYRGDALLGAALSYNLEPARYRWDNGRIFAHVDATWLVAPNQWWKPKHVIAQFKRILRQNQGVLENLALREYLAVKKLAPTALPATVNDLVSRWIMEYPNQAKRVFIKRPLTRYAARKLRHERDWSAAALSPVLMARSGDSDPFGAAPELPQCGGLNV